METILKVKVLSEETRKFLASIDSTARDSDITNIFRNVHVILRSIENVISKNSLDSSHSEVCNESDVVLLCDASSPIKTPIRRNYNNSFDDGVIEGIEDIFSIIFSIFPLLMEKITSNYALSMPFGSSNHTWSWILQSFFSVETQMIEIIQIIKLNPNLTSKLSSIEPNYEDILKIMIDGYESDILSTWVHWQEQSFSTGSHRQEWQSYSPYLRNKRISPAILQSMTLARQAITIVQQQSLCLSFVPTVSQRKSIEDKVIHFSLAILLETIKTILSTHTRLSVSRTRLWQWQIDLIYLLYASLDTLTRFIPQRNYSSAMFQIIVHNLLLIDFLLCVTTTSNLNLVDEHIHRHLGKDSIDPSIVVGADKLFEWLDLLRNRWYLLSLPSSSLSSKSVEIKIDISEFFPSKQSFSPFNFSFDLLALMGRADDDRYYKFTLWNDNEIELYKKELSLALQEQLAPVNAAATASAVVGKQPEEKPSERTMLTHDLHDNDTVVSKEFHQKPSIIQMNQDVSILACREVFVSRFINQLHLLTASLTPSSTVIGWVPILIQHPPSTLTDYAELLLRCQKELLVHGGVHLEDIITSDSRKDKRDELIRQKLTRTWVHSILLHRPELIEAVDGQQLFPPLNEAEKERIPMLMTAFASYMY